MDLIALIQECAPNVAPATMAAIVKVESSGRPYAIGVVGGKLMRQPSNLEEGIAAAEKLQSEGYNFSVGLGQVNRYNFAKYNITLKDAFDACTNIRVSGQILENCFKRAKASSANEQIALQKALSCYYSGNFSRGFKMESNGQSYVQKVLATAGVSSAATVTIPAIASVKQDTQASNEGSAAIEEKPETGVLLPITNNNEPALRRLVF